MDRVTTVMNRPFVTGTMTGATHTQPMENCHLPFTATLTSTNGGRKIELSTNGGAEYFTPAYDTSSATMLVVSVASPVTHVKFTGAASDTYYVA